MLTQSEKELSKIVIKYIHSEYPEFSDNDVIDELVADKFLQEKIQHAVTTNPNNHNPHTLINELFPYNLSRDTTTMITIENNITIIPTSKLIKAFYQAYKYNMLDGTIFRTRAIKAFQYCDEHNFDYKCDLPDSIEV